MFFYLKNYRDDSSRIKGERLLELLNTISNKLWGENIGEENTFQIKSVGTIIDDTLSCSFVNNKMERFPFKAIQIKILVNLAGFETYFITTELIDHFKEYIKLEIKVSKDESAKLELELKKIPGTIIKLVDSICIELIGMK